jgi:hypothetical protein
MLKCKVLLILFVPIYALICCDTIQAEVVLLCLLVAMYSVSVSGVT